MLNPPPWTPTTLPTAEGTAEERATGSLHTYDHTGVPQRIGDVREHRYMLPYDIGTWTNGIRGGSLVSGLNLGQVQTIDVDQVPDFWIIKVSTETTTTTVALRVYLGSGVGGPFFRLGNMGKLKLPAQGQNAITLQQLGTGIVYGTVIAVKGFNPGEIDA